MQPDTEDTSAQYDTREGAYVLAMDSILELLRTQDSKDRDAIIQKTTLLLHVADVFEPFITLYNLVGREINMLRLSLQALGLRVAISKRDATRRMKREEVRARPTPPVQGRGRSNQWAMSIPEFRERRHDAEQKLGLNATQEAIAKKIGLHVTTIRLYRKRDEVYEKLKQELGREPTEAEVDAVVLQHRQKRRSTRKK